MYCQNCGEMLNEDNKYCELCGTKQKKTTFQLYNSKKNLIGSVIIILLIIVSIKNLTKDPEEQYMNEIEQIISESDMKIKSTNSYSTKSTEETITFLEKKLDKLNLMEPPETIPKSVKDSHHTLYQGIEKIKNGIKYNDTVMLEQGQTTVAMVQLIYNNYLR